MARQNVQIKRGGRPKKKYKYEKKKRRIQLKRIKDRRTQV